LADINTNDGERIAREIGPQAAFMRLDVGIGKQWQKVIADIMKRYGRLDILVNYL
jgi:3alpha(or 20beta)-hydroxysteroid dehydrogenase